MKIVDIKYNLARYRNYFSSISRDVKSFLGKTPRAEDYKNIFIRKMFFDTAAYAMQMRFCVYRK